MITFKNEGIFYENGQLTNDCACSPEEGRKNTLSYQILQSHNKSDSNEKLKLKFDCIASHDITYVGIIQTARASGLEEFPIPYVLTNCHNSLCAVGGTINEDDHVFGLSAAKRYGGIYVPAHQAVIHQYMREQMSGCGKMILASDSHTRYGALGTLAIGEGGGELAKQLLSKTYDITYPEVVCVYLTGTPNRGVGPQDVALALIGAVFKTGFVKNKVLEFVGPGIKNLNVEYRNGIDVMTTETTCLSSVWQTDEAVREYFAAHGREQEYKELKPEKAYYDSWIQIDLSKVVPMIALPFHPSNVYSVYELNQNLSDILESAEIEANKQLEKGNFTLRDKVKNGRLLIDQGVVAGCAGGTFDNICDVADILNGKSIGNGEFTLSVYPSSQPTFLSLIDNGAMTKLMNAGASVRSAFCGPCFGAGDVPSNGSLSLRHTTRNFPNREGSKPGNGQLASVALADARTIAATALNKGVLTPATEIDCNFTKPKYFFKKEVYENRVYNGFGKPNKETPLKFGPGITDWPKQVPLSDNILLKIVSFITDPVTTTDELIPSGETSSYRSNPMGLAEFTLSRKDPSYVGKAKAVQAAEKERQEGKGFTTASLPELPEMLASLQSRFPDLDVSKFSLGSAIYANKPGDGSAREQAASCQRVLGGLANFAKEYATKRYRSNLINWGLLPFVVMENETNSADSNLTAVPNEQALGFANGDYLFVPDVVRAIKEKASVIKAYVLPASGHDQQAFKEIKLTLLDLTDDERQTLLAGCLINFYAL